MTTILEERLLTKIKKFDDEYPSTWIIDMNLKSGMKRYRMKSEFSPEEAIKFYDDYTKKLLIPELYSEFEETVYQQSDTYVHRLVGYSFNKSVFNDKYNVVVYFYSSLDDVSNFLYLDVIEQVANRLFDVKYYKENLIQKIQFYKIDLAVNEVEDLDISINNSFPVLRIYSLSKGKLNPVDYDSSGKNHFNVSNVQKFILDNI